MSYAAYYDRIEIMELLLSQESIFFEDKNI